MEIRTMVIREELIKSFRELSDIIKQVEDESKSMGIPAYKLRDANGGWVLAPLLVAKVQLLNSFVLLQNQNQKGD